MRTMAAAHSSIPPSFPSPVGPTPPWTLTRDGWYRLPVLGRRFLELIKNKPKVNQGFLFRYDILVLWLKPNDFKVISFTTPFATIVNGPA